MATRLLFIPALIFLFPFGWLISNRLYMFLVVGVVVFKQIAILGILVYWTITGEWMLSRIG